MVTVLAPIPVLPNLAPYSYSFSRDLVYVSHPMVTSSRALFSLLPAALP